MFFEIQINGFPNMEDALKRPFLCFQWSEMVKLVQIFQITLYHNFQIIPCAPDMLKMLFQF